MIVDARSLSDGTRIEADHVVVGGGPAGIVLAMELAGRGLDVCLLEAGGLGHDRAAQALAGGTVIGDPYPPLRDTRLVALGGASQVWAGWCRALDPVDFAACPQLGRPGWPIDREALMPFYRRAAPWFGLGGFDDDVPAWQARSGTRALDLDRTMFTPALFQQSRLRFGTAYREALAAMPSLRVYLHAPVERAFAHPDSDRIDHLSVRTLNGRRLEVAGRQFVLAAGGVENPRLLLASGDDPAQAIGNRHGQVGRWFTEHAFVEAGFLELDDPAPDMGFYFSQGADRTRGGFAVSPGPQARDRLLQGVICLKSADESHEVFDDPAVKAMIERVEQWRGRKVPGSAGGSLRTALRRPDRLLVAIRERMRRNGPPARRWRTRGLFECQPRGENAVRLSAAKDALGRPLAEVSWRMSELDVASIRGAHEALDRALQSAGLGRLEIRVPPDDAAWRDAAAEGAKHPMGGTRMHDAPGAGVVDRDLKVHGMHNLHVVGSSVFPTGGYANPTLTIVALAIRLADRLAEQAHLR
ncbi:FAD-dependent oxidoreductase [Geminicoccus roseus]|uniref:FAD-dependent oxidoreductase n=1 Tax=Geminicoccus roseus TaxID=404900 RepID=UPI00040970D6|nr:GMC family oxidoreductase [Geminicoccus roseus]